MRYQVVAASVAGTALLGVLVYCSPTAAVSTDDDGGGTCGDSGTNCACDPVKFKNPVDCYTGPRGSNGKGVCVTGKRTCNSGTWSDCVGQVTPGTEVCDYLDNDCNGVVDDVPGTSSLSDDAGGAPIIDTCQSPSCDPTFTDAGIACWSGTVRNACKAGNKVCGPGRQTACLAFTGIFPTPEQCNGWDDDCNDLVDDGLDNMGACQVDPEAGLLMPDGAVPTGECINSQGHCWDGGSACPPSDPVGEKCDGKDNDCNAVIDDHICKGMTDTYCCHSGSYYITSCVPSYYTTYGYTCVNSN